MSFKFQEKRKRLFFSEPITQTGSETKNKGHELPESYPMLSQDTNESLSGNN